MVWNVALDANYGIESACLVLGILLVFFLATLQVTELAQAKENIHLLK